MKFISCIFSKCFKKQNNNSIIESSISIPVSVPVPIPIETQTSLKLDILNPLPIQWNQTIQFIPPITRAQVIKVYDGDTITIASKLPFESSPLYRFSVRLAGIDAPEMNSKDNEEKECALFSQKALELIVLHKIIELKNITIEKYGRLLADIYLQDLHINKYLLENRYVVSYNGKKKIIPLSWKKYYITGEL